MTSSEHMQLIKQAIKMFPRVNYVSAESVKHARLQWIKAKMYLSDHNLTIKPLINVKNDNDKAPLLRLVS